ncbi:MAG: lectin-like domain-containing protein [Flavobacteriales bacterium]
MNTCIKYTLSAFILPGFVSGAFAQTYFLNGDAEFLGDDCYRLTEASNNQNGTVWYSDQIDLTQPFDIQFRMNLGSIDGTGADGICFVLQTVGTSAIGTNGGGMGYLDFGTSLGVEFDTWQNGEYNDPGFDHIAIHRDGNISHNSPFQLAGPVQMDPFSQNTEDGEDHVVQINWNPASQVMQVFFDCNFRLQTQVDLINSVFGGENLVYWGFTAATGGAFNNQTVCLQENILNVGDQVLICPGATAVLSAGASLDGTYTWTPADFLSDPTSATPVANPPATTTYNVQFTDLCGNNVDADITVQVDSLQVTTPPALELTCINPIVSVSASSNFPFTSYSWSTTDGEIAGPTDEASFSTSTPAWYTVTATALDVCTAVTQVLVVDNQDIPQPFAGADTLLTCAHPEIQLLGAPGTPDATVQWTGFNGGTFLSGAATNTPVINAAGLFVYTVTDATNGCVGTDTLNVDADFTIPVATIGIQDTLTCLQPQITISNISVLTEGSYTASWTTTDGAFVSATDLLQPVVSEEGLYELQITNTGNGCSAFFPVEVMASDDINIDLSSITFPNIFTPNGDEKNGTWSPFLLDYPGVNLRDFFSSYEVTVYNRWGGIVFEGNRGSFGWNGRDAAEGVYCYIARYSSACGGGLEETREGYFHLKR